MRRFKQAEEYRSPLEDKWIKWYKTYRCVVDETAEKPKYSRANIKVPEIFSHVETIAPRLVASSLASRPYVAVLPRPREGTFGVSTEESAATMEILIDHQLSERLEIFDLASKWARVALIHGIAPAGVSWRYEKRRMRVRVPDLSTNLARDAYTSFGMVIRWKDEEQDVVVYDDPWITLIDPLDFFWAPRALTIDDARYVIHRSYVTMEYLEKLEEQGVFENVKKIPLRKDIAAGRERHSERLDYLGLSDAEPDPEEPEFELLDYWENEQVITIANRETVIRKPQANPHNAGVKPFVAGYVIPSTVSLHGISVVEAPETLQDALDDWRNIRLDNATLLLYKTWYARQDTDVDPEALILRPGGFVPVPDFDCLKEIDVKDLRPSAYQEDAILREDIQRATGAWDPMRGSPMPRRATATEFAGRLEQGAFRFQDMRRCWETSGLLAAVKLMGAMNQQYIERNRLIPILGPEGARKWLDVSPEAIAGQFHYMFLGSATEPIANRDLRRQQMVQLYQIAKDDPNVNQRELLKVLFGLYDIKDPERFLTSPEQQMGLGGTGGVGHQALQGGQGPLPVPGLGGTMQMGGV